MSKYLQVVRVSIFVDSDHAICEADVVHFLSRDHEGRKIMERLRRDKPEGWRKKLADRVRTARKNVVAE